MKAASITLLTLALLVSLSYQMRGQVRRNTSASRPMTLDDEAQQQARAYWTKKFTQCGDSYFASWYNPYNPNSFGDGRENIQFVEAKGLRWDVRGQAVIPRTEAERLNARDNPNGIQWSGQTSVYFTAWRFYTNISSVNFDRGWNKWQNGGEAYRTRKMVKRNGQWSVEDDDDSWYSADCSKIPNVSSTEREAIDYAANKRGITSGKQIEIPANQMWVNTGIDVTGKRVRIKYASGKWSNGGDNPLFSDGAGGGEWSGLLVPNAPFRSLVGKTESGTFYVGNYYEGNPGRGKLYLSINDVGDFSDNIGSLRVIISLLD